MSKLDRVVLFFFPQKIRMVKRAVSNSTAPGKNLKTAKADDETNHQNKGTLKEPVKGSNDDGICWILATSPGILQGPVVFQRYADVVKYGKAEGEKRFVSGWPKKVLNLKCAIDDVMAYRAELISRIEQNPDHELNPQKLNGIKNIYCVAYSRSKLLGWAIIFNFNDFAKFSQALDGTFLLRCKTKKFSLEECQEACEWLQDEISLSKKRLETFLEASRALKN